MNENIQTSELVNIFFRNNPLITSLCIKGLINYSALCKEYLEKFISRNNKITHESLMIAMKRHIYKIQNLDNKYLENLQLILNSIQLELTNNFTIYQLKSIDEVNFEMLNSYFISKNQNTKILTCDNNTLNFKILNKNIVKISLIEKQQEMNSQYFSGLYSHILTLLSNQNVTILECVSSYDSLHLFFEETDSIRAYQILSENIKYSNFEEI